jgi:hypothetical protein
MGQREMVERSLTQETGDVGLPPRWPRRTYVYNGDAARPIKPGMIISTLWGAYWQVLAKEETQDDDWDYVVTLLLDALKPTDARAHNGSVTMLFGGILT